MCLSSSLGHSPVSIRICERGVFGKGPDSSFGGVPVGNCPDEVHIEEEGVQVKVQVEEQEKGKTHGKEQDEE